MLRRCSRSLNSHTCRSDCACSGYYMHPSVADAALHSSAVPDQATWEPSEGRIPVTLAVLAAPQRRNGVLIPLWASTASAGTHHSNRSSKRNSFCRTQAQNSACPKRYSHLIRPCMSLAKVPPTQSMLVHILGSIPCILDHCNFECTADP